MSSKRTDIDNSDIDRMYYEEDWTQQEIADYYGVTDMCIYYRLHPGKKKENNINSKESVKRYQQSDKRKYYMKEYRQSDKGKETMRKENAKHRNLGIIQFNKPFPNSEGHHINKRHIIHIPDTLHKMYAHNVWTGEGMEDINREAMDFLMYEINEGIVLRG